MMKKLMILLALMLMLSACGGEPAATEAAGSQEQTEAVATEATATEPAVAETPETEKEAPVTIEEIPYVIELQDPDSIGNVYGRGTYENKSEFIMNSFDLEMKLNDVNETTYYMTYDTVRPNETSAVFEASGPSTGLDSDMEPLNLNYHVTRGNDHYYISYDFKTQKYEYMESEPFESEVEPPVTVDQMPYEIELQEPDSIGNVYGSATVTNKSEMTVTGFSITMLLKDVNEKTYYSTYDTLLPGDTSSVFESSGPETGLVSDMEPLEIQIIVQGEDGTEYHIDYNVKTEKYDVLEIEP